MKRFLASTLALAALATSASALTITFDGELFKTADGSAMPTTGLVVLTALTEGTEFGPKPDSFTSGAEIVLQKWDLSATATAGVLQGIAANLTLGGTWNEGDVLRLYWYPTLTLDSVMPGLGTTYGTYTDAVGLDGSAAWFTPTAGQSATISLAFFTADATLLHSGGSNAANVGRADLAVAIPEPSSWLLAIGGGLAMSHLRFRRRRSR